MSDRDRFHAVGRFTIDLGLPGVIWQDFIGYRELGGDRLLKVEISERGRSDHFEGLALSIVSRTAGRIDGRWLDFDALGLERADNQITAYPDRPFVLWLHGRSFDWHIARPASLVPIREAVEDYVALWALAGTGVRARCRGCGTEITEGGDRLWRDAAGRKVCPPGFANPLDTDEAERLHEPRRTKGGPKR